MAEVLQAQMDALLDTVNSKLDKFQSSTQALFLNPLKAMQECIKDLQDSFNFLSKEYEDLKAATQEQKTTISHLKIENDVLHKKLQDLSTKTTSMEVTAKSFNVEFQGIPEIREENIVEIVQKICETTSGRPMPDSNIIACRRVAKLNPSSPRPRSVVVTLPSPRHRDSILSSVQRYNKTNSKDKLNSHSIGVFLWREGTNICLRTFTF